MESGMSGHDKPEYRAAKPHDEAFKKLLQTFFTEFIELFFPELYKLMDHRHTRLLMQELLVDVVGEEALKVDLLVETRLRDTDAYVLVHLEPQSYKQSDFRERMFIYFSRLFERHRKEHKLIVPIAIFTYDDVREEPDTLSMGIADEEIVRFRFWKVELKKQDWRSFIGSNNPVAAALLAKMGYTRSERRQVRTAFLRMMLRLRKTLDSARMAMIMSVADLYFEPVREEDEAIMRELAKENPEEGEAIMELMPAWKKWGFDEGVEKGIEKEREHTVKKLLAKGFSPEKVADTIELPIEEVRKFLK